jgi:hypothetical protein
LQDYLDLPFGGGGEIGRGGDEPEGRAIWIDLLDDTVSTLNKDYLLGSALLNPIQPVLPAHAINRIFMTPRTESCARIGHSSPRRFILR